ncbi:MAG: ribonuclease P protein component [Chitinivibrionales bacterium]|nr:ribonuclease P protein component [Chitinivibrionales bacterium]
MNGKPERQFCLPKRNRLRKQGEIRKVLTQGEKWECPFFKIIWTKSESPGGRIAVLLSKRIGNAVTRNRVKRKLKEIVRTQRANLPALDVLVVAKPAQRRPVAQLRSNFLSWKQLII